MQKEICPPRPKTVYQCQDCGKSFYTKSALKQHKHTHSSIKPFTCDVCQRSYTQFSNLCRHKRLHASCRLRLTCDFCKRSFCRLFSLNAHKKSCWKRNDKERSSKAYQGVYKKQTFQTFGSLKSSRLHNIDDRSYLRKLTYDGENQKNSNRSLFASEIKCCADAAVQCERGLSDIRNFQHEQWLASNILQPEENSFSKDTPMQTEPLDLSVKRQEKSQTSQKHPYMQNAWNEIVLAYIKSIPTHLHF